MTRHNSSLVVWCALFFSLHSSFSFLPPFDASFVLRAHCTHNWTIWIIISVYAWKSTFPKCSHRIFSCFRLDCNKIDTKRENWDTYMHVSLHNKRFATLWMEIALLLFVAAAVHVCVPSNFFFCFSFHLSCYFCVALDPFIDMNENKEKIHCREKERWWKGRVCRNNNTIVMR